MTRDAALRHRMIMCMALGWFAESDVVYGHPKVVWITWCSPSVLVTSNLNLL